jgi:hypothetical protein
MDTTVTIDQADLDETALRIGEQQRLFGDFEQVDGYELKLTGTSGLRGNRNLTLGGGVCIVITGRVIRQTHEVRDIKDVGELLVRVATVNAARAQVVTDPERIRELLDHLDEAPT